MEWQAVRYDSDHKAKTREKVLKVAAKALRAEGPHKLAVGAIMARAGLTHGGFYAHFPSRDVLIAEAIGEMFRDGRSRIAFAFEGRDARDGLAAYIDFYLSEAHRDTRTAGCPLPFLAADAPRLPSASRERYAQGVAYLTARLANKLTEIGHPHAEDEAGSMLSEMVGALGLARAEPDPEISDRILARSRTTLKRRLGLEDVQ